MHVWNMDPMIPITLFNNLVLLSTAALKVL